MPAEQLDPLKKLLASIEPGNSFYTRKFSGLHFGTRIASLDDFFERAPFTEKRELIEDQRQHPPYGTNLTYPLNRYARFCQTSGTSGQPMRWLDTPESWDWMCGNWARVYRAAGITSQDRIFFAFSFGPFLGFWTAFDAATRMGALAIPGGGMRSAVRLHTILDNRATVLCCTPTYAIHLAEAAIEERIDLKDSSVRRIIVAGEPGGSIPSTRAHIEKLWPGARVVDHHGMTETGPVSYSCSARANVLHVIESSYIAEVIDPTTGRASSPEETGPGETGELVLTNLGRIGSPLLRYRTGDLVRASARGRCECGSEDLALEGGILGRTDDMVVVRGVNVYPSAIEEILRAEGGVAEYRVEVRTERALVELQISIEPEPGVEALSHRIEAALTNALSLRIPVSCVPAGTLPRFEAKARRWIKIP